MTEPAGDATGGRSPAAARGSTKRAPRTRGVSADVRRGQALALAAFATLGGALVAAALGALLRGGAGRRFEPSVPHQRAGLTCAQCHEAPVDGATIRSTNTSAHAGGVPDTACVGCHGAHESTRAAHRIKQRSGELRCATCHTSHAEDEGVIFSPSGSFERYRGRAWVGGETRFRPAQRSTVPLVPLGACGGCHRLEAADDPIARCLVGGDPRGATACFDEHRRALADGESAAGRATGGVCRSQHEPARPFAWDTARLVAAGAPAPRPGTTAGWLALFAMTAGCLAGALTLWGFGRRGPRGQGSEGSAGKDKQLDDVDAVPLVPTRRVRLPRIDESRCLGCFACVDACPYDVLAIENYVAKVVREEACCGVVLCQQRCPNGSLVIAEGALRPDVPPVTGALESELTPGIFLAGDVTGGSLIKNAIRQGTAAMDAAAASLAAAGLVAKRAAGDQAPGHDVVDVAIVGAGPAGIAAALRAKELGLRFVVVERGSVAESIRSFPRGKLVFDQPLELPAVGKLWLAEATKEELLGQWLRIVRREGLLPHVRERQRLDSVQLIDENGRFRLQCSEVEPTGSDDGSRSEIEAHRVVLAIGKRGTARRLGVGIPETATSLVHYHLADARSFEGQRLVVVGLGDVAMEAALALAGQAGTTVTLVHRGPSFARGSERNVAAVQRAVQSGRIRLVLNAEVTAVTEATLTLEVQGAEAAAARGGSTTGGPRAGSETVPIDALFVLIGHEPPRKALVRWGVLPDEDDGFVGGETNPAGKSDVP
jgi:thioredoxin reductase